MASIALNRPVETSHARGLSGTPSCGQLLHRGRERVVKRLLGEVEVAEQANQRGEDAARVGAVDSVYRLAGSLGASSLTNGKLPLWLIELHDRPHLDAARAGRRDLRGHLDGVVQVPRFDE